MQQLFLQTFSIIVGDEDFFPCHELLGKLLYKALVVQMV